VTGAPYRAGDSPSGTPARAGGPVRAAFKEVLAGAAPEDVVEFMSVAGLPARAVATPWLRSHLAAQPRKAELARAKARCVMAFDCLIQCGLRDGIGRFGQFCIDRQLAAAMNGDVRTGLFFRGAGRLPFGTRIRPVGDLLRLLLAPGPAPAPAPAAAPGPAPAAAPAPAPGPG
jgi:nitronate monooxygenase